VAACYGLQGSGLWLYERATPEAGTANAGVAARAEDAATALNNPAGMTRLDGGQVMLGLQPMFLNIQFDPDSRTTTTGSAGNADDILPALGAYYAQPLGERWAVGFSLGSHFGLGVKYEDDWVGRYYLRETALLTLSGTPSVGFKVNDWLSIGAGVPLQYAGFKMVSAINRPLGLPDGQMTFEDNSFGVGGLFSLLLEPTEWTRFGVSYATPVQHQFKDTPEISGPPLSPPETSIDMTVPQGVVLSAYQELGERWALMGNVGWQNWREFGQMILGFDAGAGRTVTTDRNFEDTWHFGIGGHYRVHEDWRLTAGFAYDTSPVNDEYRTVDMPLDRQFRYSAGAIWDVSEHWTLGLAYTFLDLGKAQIDQTRPFAGTLSGDYSKNYVHVLSLNANWRF
jgi:long-chain fatty acid transport protein